MKQTTRAWLRAWLRPGALAMAAAMVLSSVPVSAPMAVPVPLPVVTAYAATVPVITFLNGDTEKDAHVITGNTIYVQQSYNGSTYVGTSTSLTSQDGLVFIDKSTNGITISEGTTNTSPNGTVTKDYSISFADSYNPEAKKSTDLGRGNKYKAQKGYYNVRAVYSTYMTSAIVTETVPGSGGRQSSAAVGNTVREEYGISRLAVMSTSKIRILCTKGEDGYNRTPEFQILTDTAKGGITPTGIFSAYTKDNATAYAGASTNDGVVAAGKQRTLELTLECSSANAAEKTVPLTLRPTSTFTVAPKDVDSRQNGKYKDSGLEVGKTYNYIQTGTIFEISFTVPDSEPIFLTVMTPQGVIEEIEGEIRKNEKNAYLVMSNGEKQDYIESDFQLLYALEKFGGMFKIDWQWVPTQYLDSTTGLFTNVEDDPDPNHNLKYYVDLLSNVPTIGSSRSASLENPYIQAGLSQRPMTDVTGYLVPIVQYQVNGANYQVTSSENPGYQVLIDSYSYYSGRTLDESRLKALRDRIESTSTPFGLPVIPITIKGTGAIPYVSVTHKTTGTTTNTSPGAVAVLDSGVNPRLQANNYYNELPEVMDAFRGGIDPKKYPNWTIKPTGPFKYTLGLNMGERNGAAPYAVVEVRGVTSALSFEVNYNGTYVAPNTTTAEDGTVSFQIDNRQFVSGNSVENTVSLDLIAEQLYTEGASYLRSNIYVTVTFYRERADGGYEVNRDAIYPLLVQTVDNTPGQDNRLKSLEIIGRSDVTGEAFSIGEDYGYSFDPDTRVYNVTIPFRASSIRLVPTLWDNRASNNPIRMVMTNANYQAMKIRGADDYRDRNMPDDNQFYVRMNPAYKDSHYRLLNGGMGNYNGYPIEKFYIPFHDSADFPNKIDDMVNTPYTIYVKTPAQDPRPDKWQNEYILNITRALPSDDNTLKSLGVYLESDEYTNLITNFDPVNLVYDVSVPYSTKLLKVLAEKNDAAAEGPDFLVRLDNLTASDKDKEEVSKKRYPLQGKSDAQPNPAVWLRDVKELFKDADAVGTDAAGNPMVMLTFTIQSERGYITDQAGDAQKVTGMKTYTIRVSQLPPNTDPLLSGLTVTDKDENPLPFTTTFSPTNYNYTISIPYSVGEVRFAVTPNDPNVARVELWQGDVPADHTMTRSRALAGFIRDLISNVLGDGEPSTGAEPGDGSSSENGEPGGGGSSSESTDPESSSSESTEPGGESSSESSSSSEGGEPGESSSSESSTQESSSSSESSTPSGSGSGSESSGGSHSGGETSESSGGSRSDGESSESSSSGSSGSGGGDEDTSTWNSQLVFYQDDEPSSNLKFGVPTMSFPVYDKTSAYAKAHNSAHPFVIRVWAEDAETYAEYTVRVIREEPSHDAALIDLKVKDGQNVEINTFVFNSEMFGCEDGNEEGEEKGKDTYHIGVPYSTRQVSFIATARHQYATIEIREEDQTSVLGKLAKLFSNFFSYFVESGANSRVFNLSDKTGKNNPKEFHIVVTAEDGVTKRAYCLKIYREPPSNDARLKSLVTQNTSEFKPLFIASKTAYTAVLNEGAPGIIVIPTANHPNATIRVNGVVVQSGSPSALIELIEITTTINVEVTAEDGRTKMVYKITVTNPNLIEKTSNADLKDLRVNYGLMTPTFQSAITEYEVTTKETLWSVDIIPKLADPLATMRVLSGSRVLGDYNGNYAMAIVDGQNDVSVEVTSPDGTVTKTYDVAIFRNDEEKLKNLVPLEAEDINFEQVSNPIIVKIDEYPRVGASVFNTIREEYPDYSIVFQGNDYSIRFDGKNLTRVIPQTEIYDFRMTYASPDEDTIYDHIAEYEYNDDIIDDVVMPYFDYHGSLPGPATFSLSLGRFYANDLLYWHHYNIERDRIDYYGTLRSNSQGTIAVSIDHFSTYIVSPEHRIAGSEDKDGVIDELGMVSNGKDLLSSGGKLNPDTGTEEAP